MASGHVGPGDQVWLSGRGPDKDSLGEDGLWEGAPRGSEQTCAHPTGKPAPSAPGAVPQDSLTRNKPRVRVPTALFKQAAMFPFMS